MWLIRGDDGGEGTRPADGLTWPIPRFWRPPRPQWPIYASPRRVIDAIGKLDHDAENPYLSMIDDRRVNSFIQTYKKSRREFITEYGGGRPHRQYRTAGLLSEERVGELFLAYLARDSSFKTRTNWRPMDKRFQPDDDAYSRNDPDLGQEWSPPVPAGIAPELAETIAARLREKRYGGDFTTESLAEIDRLVDEYLITGRTRPRGLVALAHLPSRHRTRAHVADAGVGVGDRLRDRCRACADREILVSVGCYVGEVLRRHQGGRWEIDPDEPDDPAHWRVAFSSDSFVYPILSVLDRFDRQSYASLSELVQDL